MQQQTETPTPQRESPAARPIPDFADALAAPAAAARRSGSREAFILLCFVATLFVSATMLFLVQPMVGKMILPLLGGTPAVWNTCMVFFQAVLLAGYAYAHVTTTWLGLKRQALLHAVLLLAVLTVLPIAVGRATRPPTNDQPVFWLLWQLTLFVGLPFFVVSTTSPLLQKWFSGTGHRDAKDPYFLYAAGNIGSLLALLGYPLILQPIMTLTQQSRFWSMGFGVLIVMVLLCALIAWRSPAACATGERHRAADGPYTSTVSMQRRMWWVFTAFVPSSLMLGVTAHITSNLAPVPLLWVVPLAIYLLTMILVFARRTWIPQSAMAGALPFLVLPVALLTFLELPSMAWLAIVAHLVTFFVAAMVCHGELARSRPAAEHLTEFYLWMSVGGVLGGIFNAIIAPSVFTIVAEYPLAMVLACLVRCKSVYKQHAGTRFPSRPPVRQDSHPAVHGLQRAAGKESRERGCEKGFSHQDERGQPSPLEMKTTGGPPPLEAGDTMIGGVGSAAAHCVSFIDSPMSKGHGGVDRRETRSRTKLDMILPIGVALLGLISILCVHAAGLQHSALGPMLMFLPPMVLCFSFKDRPLRFALGFGVVAATLAVHSNYSSGTPLYAGRNFFGVKRVVLDSENKLRKFVHGTTFHGIQYVDPARSREPLAYYHRTGPIGDVFRACSGPRLKKRIGAIGLGAGSVASYAEPGQHITFYEIDPEVARIARDPAYFSFLSQCRGDYDIVLGDGRLTIADARDHGYGLIILDAFSSDAIPTHLLTREALQLYVQKLEPDGVMAFHISNSYLDLKPLLGALASEAGLMCWSRDDLTVPTDPDLAGKSPSQWVVMARAARDVGDLPDDPNWHPLPPTPGCTSWTDQQSSLLSIFRWQ